MRFDLSRQCLSGKDTSQANSRMASKLSSKKAVQRASRFCALKERSPNEVFKKIKSWGLNDLEAKKVLKIMVDQNYVNEERFANAYCHDKFEFNSWGKQKIRARIHPHQISKKYLEQALDRIDQSHYQNRIASLAQKKWDSLQKEKVCKKRRQKTVSYLASKGFEIDLIWETLNDLLDK